MTVKDGKTFLLFGALCLALSVAFCAGAANAKTPAPAAKVQDARAKPSIKYSGNRKTRRFHRSSCRYFSCKNCTVVFRTRQEAIKAGFIPCKVCNP